jgi:endonuclease-3
MAQALVQKHGGQVPASIEALTALPGVGRKTANVVLGHALHVPGLPVDRHVLRVSNRIGIAESDDPEVVERQLGALLPSGQWTLASDTLILHGRRICRPKPLCDSCVVQNECDYYQRAGADLVRRRRKKTTKKITSKKKTPAHPTKRRQKTARKVRLRRKR